MAFITVSEYASRYKISVQAVYQRIKSGSISCEIKEGVKMIEVQNNPASKKSLSKCKAKLKSFKASIKALKREIVKSEQIHQKSFDNLQKMFDMVLHIKEIKSPVIDAKLINKKSKKKRKKK